MSDDVMTVGELIKLLQAAPQDAIVMLECGDDFYSGPVDRGTSLATAVLFGPHTYLGPDEDAFGRPIQRTPYTLPGGWVVLDEAEGRWDCNRGPILERRQAFVLRNS